MLLSELGINKKTVTLLNKKKIYTTNDMARFVPRKYKDYREVVTLHQARLNEDNAIIAHMLEWEEIGTKPRFLVAKLIDEESGDTFKVSWIGCPYMKTVLKAIDGSSIVVAGKLTKNEKLGYLISSPDYFELSGGFIPKIMPVYKKYKGISEQMIKTLVYESLKRIDYELVEKTIVGDMLSYKDALYKLHYPKTLEDIEEGRKRLLYNDLLYFSMELQKSDIKENKGFEFPNQKASIEFVNALPFNLSEDQKNVCNKILMHTKKGERCNILVQGDVGCGKTIVAFTSMVNAYENGYQSVLIAPTQVLAEQHYLEFTERTSNLNAKVAYLYSGIKAAEKRKILKGIENGEYDFIIGTHVVFSKDVIYNKLGLIVTDEEHKFGVAQKESLKKKAANGVHVISMSATPIPRSLAGIYFGENKEFCVIKSMPKGRIPIQTATQVGHKNTFNFMLGQIKKGHQCYVVCPAITSPDDEDEEGKFKLKNIEEVKKEYEKFFLQYGIKIGVVHGKMSKAEMFESIEAFTHNEVQILMSTTLIEVGVNVPNATVMVIEQAEQFGLASLHQLRGRVGRNSLPSYCILISDDKANERLKCMCDTTSGFEIAEKDLELRGGGDLIGTKQSGFDNYIKEIISNPTFYDKAKNDAKICLEKGYGTQLIKMYKEHEELCA